MVVVVITVIGVLTVFQALCKMLYVLYLIKLKERYEEGTVILLTLQVRKLRPREVK